MEIFFLQKHGTTVCSEGLDWASDLTSTDISYSSHRDIALNGLFAANSKQIDLNLRVIECKADANSRQVIQLNADNVSQIEAVKSPPNAA